MSSDLWHAAESAESLQDYLDDVRELGDQVDDHNDVVEALVYADKWLILESLKDHPVYGKRATEEIDAHKSHELWKKQWAAHVESYPPIIKEIREAFMQTKRIGIFDIAYPSLQAQRHKLGDQFFALQGDGMFLFMFEVLSFEGRGSFRFAPDPNGKETSDSIQFRSLTKHQYGDVLTGDELKAAINLAYPF